VMHQMEPQVGSLMDYLSGRNLALSTMLTAAIPFTGGVVIMLMAASDVIDRCFGVELIDDRKA
jgi:hypothetical protein